jgi:Mn2+/Fe2+ NRAMP family transporter
MSNTESPLAETPAAPLPRTFGEYVRSFGPGLVVVLTWLGAGDIVDMSVAGGNYGYSLMWVLVVAVVMRFLFVSLIAKYQLCNQHGEGVLDGLVRLHPLYAPLLLLAAVVMGHFYGSYMTAGIGEACKNVTGIGEIWHWAVLWNGIALILVFQPAYNRIEFLFKVFLAVLSVSFVGTAIWIGPDVQGILTGLYRMEVPQQKGEFGPLLVAVAMIGAVGGSLMNLVYPYFLEAKGWRGPQYRRVQLYDFLLAIVVMIVLDLAIWILGAELLYPQQLKIGDNMDGLPRLLSGVLGSGGRILFYVGIFSAVFTSLVGHAMGLGYMGSHALMRWKTGPGTPIADFRAHPCYRWIVVWCLVSPLIWTAPGMPGFVKLTLVVNSAQVLMLPVIAGGLWWITADKRYIGIEHRNRWWENGVMALLFALAIYGAISSAESVKNAILGQ